MAEKDGASVSFLEQEFVTIVQVDYDIGTAARLLCRKHPILKKPNDSIHLATAILRNLDIFHSYDRDDLVRLDGTIQRRNGDNYLFASLWLARRPSRPRIQTAIT
jgi:predicted nucleic acid-binding protein